MAAKQKKKPDSNAAPAHDDPTAGGIGGSTDRAGPVPALERLRTAVLFLALMALAVSAALNAYVVFDNARIQGQLDDSRDRISHCKELHQFSQRMVSDLNYMSRTDRNVGEFLRKYRAPISKYQLGSAVAPSRGQ